MRQHKARTTVILLALVAAVAVAGLLAGWGRGADENRVWRNGDACRP